MKQFYLLTIIFLFQFSYAQQMPIDFSDGSDIFNVWGGSTFTIESSPINSSNPTGQFFRSASTDLQGHYIDLIQPINLDNDDEITLRFYAFDPNMHTIVVRLENGTNPDVEVSQTSSVQNTWVDLTFDFSTVSGSGQYTRLVIRIDDGSSIPGAFRIDDINDGSVIVDPNELDVIYTDLVWSDEFDIDMTVGNEDPDSNNWFRQTQLPAGGNWFNGEEQHYTNELSNSYVDDNGFLNIVAIQETYTDQGETKQYTSARLNSKFAFTYGRVDVRAKLPFGDGTWPAIWTLGKNVNEDGAFWDNQGFGTTTWPACGEIDIMEHGLHATNEVSSAIHSPSSFGNTMNTATQMLADVANDFHVYSVNWSPNQITFLIDDVGYYTYNPVVKDASTWPFDLDQYLILNIAMGGFSGTIDSGFTQSSMVIDYVRVYQNVLSLKDVFASNFKVYPNPASDKITISTNETINSIELYDILGHRVINERGDVTMLNTSELKTGMYLLKINAQEKSVTKKLIIN